MSREENLMTWFAGSKVVDSEGNPLRVYHGLSRPDRLGNIFLKSRATSGPMPFFSENPEISSGYATGKKDTSMEESTGYIDWYKIKSDKIGRSVNINLYWYFCSNDEKEDIANRLPHIIDWDEERGELSDFEHNPEEYGVAGKGSWEYSIKSYKGNVLRAALEIWVESAHLFNYEYKFVKVMKMGGVRGEISFHDPNAMNPAIIPVYLRIQNPLDTSNIPEEVVNVLKREGRLKRGSRSYYARDLWDKRSRSGKEWLEALEDDIHKGTTHAWTSIPDWVTKTLKNFGYDGIKDRGGKYHETSHTVWIPFHSEQIKSAIGNKGSFSLKKRSIIEDFLSSESGGINWGSSDTKIGKIDKSLASDLIKLVEGILNA